MKSLLKAAVPLLDLCLALFVLPSAFVMKLLRRAGVERFPLSRKALSAAGVFPIADHYYEPLINFDSVKSFVHIHDIFTPRDYPKAWAVDKVRLWDEQYLMEALLSGNPNWRIIGAVNHLKHDHYDALKSACPFLTPDREPGSFYIEHV